MLEELTKRQEKLEPEIIKINARQDKMEKQVVIDARERAEFMDKCKRQEDQEMSIKENKERHGKMGGKLWNYTEKTG